MHKKHEAVRSLVYKGKLYLRDLDRDILFVRYLDPSSFGDNPVFTVELLDEKSIETGIQCITADSYEEYIETWYKIFPKGDSNIELRTSA